MNTVVASRLIAVSTIALGCCLTTAGIAKSEWMSERQFKASVKNMKRAGNYPASMDCRATPQKRIFKPQLKATWRKNSNKIDWTMYYYKGQLDFTPNQPGKPKKYRRVVRKILKAGAGGTVYRCSLFYKR